MAALVGRTARSGVGRRNNIRIDMDQLMVHSSSMEVSVTDAKAQLTELVRRAEAGNDIVLTRHGHPAVRLVPVRAVPDRAVRRAFLAALSRRGGAKAIPGPCAARSQDFLYREDGLPE